MKWNECLRRYCVCILPLCCVLNTGSNFKDLGKSSHRVPALRDEASSAYRTLVVRPTMTSARFPASQKLSKVYRTYWSSHFYVFYRAKQTSQYQNFTCCRCAEPYPISGRAYSGVLWLLVPRLFRTAARDRASCKGPQLLGKTTRTCCGRRAGTVARGDWRPSGHPRRSESRVGSCEALE